MKTKGSAPPPSVSDAEGDDAYRLAGIQPTTAPSGSVGRDWLTYRIAQGANIITGYRQGDLRSVTAEIERIVSGLNERRIVKRGRVDLKPKAAAAQERTPPLGEAEQADTADAATD